MKKKYLFRISILIILISVFLIYISYPCLVLKLSSFPKIIKDNMTVEIDGLLFIYGDAICGVCPQGRFVAEKINKSTTMIIYPPKLRSFEIDNFKESYEFNNAKTVMGNAEIVDFLKNFHSCSRNEKLFSESSFYIRLDKDKKIKEKYIF